ncbi:DUF433 domain-containing protein [uncultured Sphingomonas sp.]|uniref:DUF433 domain-containing protein n=1 Tax=uncultured Sphingomonas sp. TaxID=158754 RepID=UPI0035CAFE43
MNWRDHIEARPDVMGGKPVIRDTRITVEIILDWLAAGWSEAELFESYPRLSPDDLKAIFAFAREVVGDQLYAVVPKAA